MNKLTNDQRQVILSGVLGDGAIKGGRAYFSCIHKEYMDFKKEKLGDLALLVERKENNGYKKGAFIYKLYTLKHPEIEEIGNYSFQQIVDELDELGISMWVLDDGSRHHKNNFYNLNTHAIDREVEENVLIPFFNRLNIFPRILTEKKKDGRVFSYLYISKWLGAMTLSAMVRKLNLECFAYKLMPTELEDVYEKVKDIEGFSEMTALHKTHYVKKLLDIKHKTYMHKNVTSTSMPYTDSSKI